LLLATAISAICSLVLAATNNFTILLIGSLISGLGIGFYWPADEAVVADASQIDNRRETFALASLGHLVEKLTKGIARLADNLGLASGIVVV
jgi:predicted MFS family arabinose efflux permease